METVGKVIKSPEGRKYVYGVVLAVIPILVAYGVISENMVDSVTVLIGAVLGLGATALAVVNTPSSNKSVSDKEDEEVNDTYEHVPASLDDAFTEIKEVKQMLADIIESLNSNYNYHDEMGE